MAKKIMIVDDDIAILDAFQAMLESDGYQVSTSSDPETIFNLSQENFPDLIFLDVLLSGVDGRDICKKLKSDPELKNIPIIMVSAAPNMEKTIRQAGANDFISKPFEMDNLLKTVKKHLAKKS